MKFARLVFLVAGVWGFAILVPQYFLEAKTNTDYPPAITHPEFFYGFIGVALAFQIVFLIISRDPARFRPMMLAGVAEKFLFGVACWALFVLGRVHPIVAGFGTLDLILGVLFIAAYAKTGSGEKESS